MSLAWGTGLMAAEFAQETGQRRAAVIGCGSPGLTAARQLQRRGFDVTIYAATVPPDTTSNMSLAGFTPASGLVENDRRTPEWDAQYRRAADISYRQLQLMVGPQWRLLDGQLQRHGQPGCQGRRGGGRGNETTATDAELLPAELRPNRNREVLGPGEHPFPTQYAIRTPARCDQAEPLHGRW